jgi:hypothetical protein
MSTSSAATFSVSVSQPARLGPVPEDTDLSAHHVKNASGKTTHFTNPHPSFKAPLPREVFWYLVLYVQFTFNCDRISLSPLPLVCLDIKL